MKIDLKMFVVWIGIILLECHWILSIGYVRPENAVKRTMIDISRLSDLEPVSKIKHNHRPVYNSDKRSKHEKSNTFSTSYKDTEQNLKNTIFQENKDANQTLNKNQNIQTASKFNLSKNHPVSSSTKAENAKKKQYSTDDFRVNSMSNEPMMTADNPPPIMAPVPNHVTIDNFDEGIHLPMEEHHHFEPEPEPPHIEPHIEEPVYVHHVEPPPPPPPEPVMVPVPIAAPPPPPPPPPPCTVHIPVTIHLKGKLSIKMRHCENCDFSKNIEAIGPLKIAPINGIKDKLAGAVEAQAKKAFLESTQLRKTKVEPIDQTQENASSDISGVKRNTPPIADIDDVLKKADEINFDENYFNALNGDDLGEAVLGTKKDVTEEEESVNESNKKHILVAKPVVIPGLLLPTEAFKRGVVISLPKGKALLKCIAPTNETEAKSKTAATESGSTEPQNTPADEISNEALSPPSAAQTASYLTPEPPKNTETSDTFSTLSNDVVTLSDPEKTNNILLKPTSTMEKTSNRKDPSSNSYQDKSTHPTNKSHQFTEQFLKMFDKDMLVSLYRMAVKDILSELQHQKKTHRRAQLLHRRMGVLKRERSSLEKMFPGITKSLVEPVPYFPINTLTREMRSADDIDETSDEKEETFTNSQGISIKVNPQVLHTANGNRRVKLVDTYRIPVNVSLNHMKSNKLLKIKEKSVKAIHNITKNVTKEPTQEEASSALSFYGDLDPTKLMEESPTCIDAMCEKHKQFIKHAGQYFESLDSIALEPYKKFMNDQKDRSVSITTADESSLYELPFGANSDVVGIRRNDVIKRQRSTKRQSIIDSMESTGQSKMDDNPNTIVELFGKLPRVPLKITLNPKGPLAKMKKPIEIDLRPPGKGEPSSKMIATANDPTVAIHVANKIFKEEPLDAKQEQKLQSVYADIKKRSIIGEKHAKHIYLEPQKVINEKGSRRMRIVVSLPKELTNLVSKTNYLSTSRSLASETLNEKKISPVVQVANPSYVVGQANEDKLVGKEPAETKAQIEEYEVKLKELKDKTAAAMMQYNKIKDPYSDIGKKRRFSKHESTKKHEKKLKKDPYADMGAEVATTDKRSSLKQQNIKSDDNTNGNTEAKAGSDIKLFSLFHDEVMKALHAKEGKEQTTGKSDTSSQQNETVPNNDNLNIGLNEIMTGPSKKAENNMKMSYDDVAKDPYATLGSAMSTVTKREKFPKRRKKLDKRSHKHHFKKKPINETNSDKRNHFSKIQTRQDIQNQAGLSLIHHGPQDISKEVTVDGSVPIKDEHSLGEAENHVKDDPQVNVDTTKPLNQDDKSSMLTAFPKFSEALSKISPQNRKKLLNLKPFKFLSTMDSQSIPYTPNSKPNGKDPYADMGSEVSSSKRKEVATQPKAVKYSKLPETKKRKTITANASKRSEAYDPYADLGTSIGLTQNEARAKPSNNTQTVNVTLLSQKNNEIKNADVATSTESQNQDPNHNTKQEELMLKGLKQTTALTREPDNSNVPAQKLNQNDPYADLGSSANRQTPTNKSNKTTSSEPTVKNKTEAFSHRVKKLQSEVEHFIGKLKLPVNEIDVENKEAETVVTEQSEIADRATTVPQEKSVAAENDLATIERLEKDIAAEKVKAEALEFPPSSVLEKNVGKEIQGPYADMGTKKKTVGLPKETLNNVSDQKRTGKRQGVNKPKRMKIQNLRLTKQKLISDMIKRLTQVTSKRKLAVTNLKSKMTKKCATMDAEEVTKLKKHTPEENAVQVNLYDPYNSIGKEAKKNQVNPCQYQVIKEDDSTEAQQPKKVKIASSTSVKDPYTDVGSSVHTAEKKKVIKPKPVEYDPYADLGTRASRTNIIKVKTDSKLYGPNILQRKNELGKSMFTRKT